MNIVELLKISWRITTGNGALWGLMVAMFALLLPAIVLGGAFGAGTALVALPPTSGLQSDWIAALRQWPVGVWVLIAFIVVVVLIATNTLAWIFQAAVMRGADLAASRGPGGKVSLREAVSLGRQRLVNILTLSIVLGGLLVVLGLLPVFLRLALALWLPAANLRVVETSFQTLALPFNTIASIGLLLVMMSVALEEVRPRAAFRQAWRVFRKGWWGFLLVITLTSAASVALTLLLTLLLVILFVGFLITPWVGAVLALGVCGVGGPISAALMIFIAVYTQVLYTLVYRAAQQLEAAQRRDATPPVPKA